MIGIALERLNQLSTAEAQEVFRACCGATAWCDAMVSRRPIVDRQSLHAAADQSFDILADADWLEAFACHPKIGDIDSLRMKFAGNAQWSAGEQAGASEANEETLRQLAIGNQQYEMRFGFIFIVCATGKTADQMLELLRVRLANSADDELKIAAAQQRRITHLRIDKLFDVLLKGTPG